MNIKLLSFQQYASKIKELLDMGVYDREWNRVVKRILDEGMDQPIDQVYSKYRDGKPSVRRFVTSERMHFPDVSILPVTQHKYISKTAPLIEKDLFWKDKSNDIELLRARNIGIWDDWIIEDDPEWAGTIGPSYGYVLGIADRPYELKKLKKDLLDPSKEEMYYNRTDTTNGIIMLDQVDFTMQNIVNNPMGTDNVTSLWNTQYLHKMALKPCVWGTMTSRDIHDKLNMDLIVRSNDMGLGNAYNVFQYADLMHEWSHVMGLGLGSLTVTISNAHLYDRHLDIARRLLEETTDQEEATLTIDPSVKNFYEIDSKKHKTITGLDPNKTRYRMEVSIS